MACNNRTLSTLALLGLLTASLVPAARSQSTPSVEVRRKTYAISGTIGVVGVTLTGFPGNVRTDDNGVYSVEVPESWKGVVKPVKIGYAFEPSSRTYSPVTEDYEGQDYVARLLTFTISGNVGLPEVVLQGFPQEVMSDSQGKYQAQVDYGWAGTVAPMKVGYQFEPEQRIYRRVTKDFLKEDYVPRLHTYTISGHAGAPGVVLQGFPQEIVSDSQGMYQAEVNHGWSGTVVPRKKGFAFTPPEMVYTSVGYSFGSQNYAAQEQMVTISNAVPAGNVLVIPTADAAPERIAETTEDLRVMLQILREKLSEPRMIRGVLRDYGSLLGEDRRAEAIYLEGSAALFVIGADFPASSPSQQPGEGELRSRPQGEAADPVWQRARQKLHSPGARTPSPSGQTQTMTFEQFQEELLRSLKHAANIRHIDPNELIVLTLIAQNEDTSRTADADLMRQYENIYGSDYKAMMGLGHPAPATTVLTMQAKKADIDAFAQGALDFDKFRQKVRSFTY
jgi:hypothetical protein